VVNKICRCGEGLIPKFQRQGSMGEQGEAHFDYVVMLALCCSILLMRVWARDMMGDAYTLKEGCKFLVLPSLDGLNGKDFLVEETFQELLKLMKFMKHIRFTFQEINPSKFVEIINEQDIILEFSN
jgi:hypothetical protein